MEGERRKRKLERDEEENEEEKMEKFFALIKSTKDARDQLFNKDSKKANEVGDLNKVWTPMFQPEDFIDCGELRKSNNHVSTATQHAGPSQDKEKEKGKEVMQIDKEAITPALMAPTPESPHEPEDKEKATSDPLDLNLSL